MSQPSSPLEAMRDSAHNMHAARREHRDAIQQAARSKHAYKVGWAKALLKAKGTEKARMAEADVATADQLLEKELAEGLAVSALEAVRNGHEEVGMWRSYVSASKEGVAVEWMMAEQS